MLRTETCGALRAEHAGQPVTLSGWVAKVRDHGGVYFADLRDRYGRTQVVVHDDAPEALRELAKSLRTEFVVQVQGTVQLRDESVRNPKMDTGDIEVVAEAITVLSTAKTTPFEIENPKDLEFGLRMKYRYLDLRRAEPKRLLELRSRVVDHIRRWLGDREFLEIETPILFKSTPEGAREFLVPSRLNKGKFYALPQSPQQFKQLLMVAGVDRYFQIARCFRDEDPRIDRQWEFTQLDIEASFVEPDDIYELITSLYLDIWARFAPGTTVLASPVPKITYAEAMRRWGTDKPDLRFGCEHHDVTELFRGAGPPPIQGIVEQGGEVRAFAVPAGGQLSRKKIDGLEKIAREHGAGALGWLDLTGEKPRGNMLKALADGQADQIAQAVDQQPGDTIFILAGAGLVPAEAGDAVRRAAAELLGLIPDNVAAFAWIHEFPLFLRDTDDTRWVSSHHPFTMPRPEDLEKLESDPGAVRSFQYDLTCNGHELAGGSIRIHDPEIQQRVFTALGLSAEEQEHKFAHLLEAFSYGTPPHGGIAGGIDRLAALVGGLTAIREVIAFPKTAKGQDLMSGSPSPAEAEQLAELGITVVAPPADEPSSVDDGPGA
ncbi:MAG: aspartate--tRNA ligase [Planctomycetota bacterium]